MWATAGLRVTESGLSTAFQHIGPYAGSLRDIGSKLSDGVFGAHDFYLDGNHEIGNNDKIIIGYFHNTSCNSVLGSVLCWTTTPNELRI